MCLYLFSYTQLCIFNKMYLKISIRVCRFLQKFTFLCIYMHVLKAVFGPHYLYTTLLCTTATYDRHSQSRFESLLPIFKAEAS